VPYDHAIEGTEEIFSGCSETHCAQRNTHMPKMKKATRKRGFVVLRKIRAGTWELLGKFDYRPGSTSRTARYLAVREATNGKARPGEVYAAVPRSEWRVALDWQLPG
jgi:hypothetical protein